MTTADAATEPAPTDEQRAAWLRLSNSPNAPSHIGGSVEEDAALIAQLLPPSLTVPEPALPKEPGRYEDRNGDSGWEVYDDGTWHYNGGVMQMLSRVQHAAPFRRLVPERPPVTREQVQKLVADWYESGKHGVFVDAIISLANGTDQ